MKDSLRNVQKVKENVERIKNFIFLPAHVYNNNQTTQYSTFRGKQ